MGRDSATCWDKGTMEQAKKSCQGTGRARTAKIRDGTGWNCKYLERDVGQNGTEQKRTF